jgi:hypothetical protein
MLMKDRSHVLARCASTTVVAWLLAACGSYENPSGTGGAGGMSTGGTGGSTGGSSATGGMSTGGTGGSSATGGMSTGGASGASTTGGAGGAGAGGAGGAEAGGAGSAGAAGMSGASGSAGMSGAGGSGQAPACTDTAACGGAVVGTWLIAGSGCGLTLSGMANLIPAGIGCTSAPIDGKVTVAGSFTAMEGGMFMDATTTVGDATLQLAPECLMISGFAAECDRINLDSAGLVGIACVDNTETMGCDCTLPINQTGGLGVISYEGSSMGALSGTFTTMDNKLVTTLSSDLATEYAYCVAETTLTLTVSMPTNAGTVTGPIVLQKQ